MKTQLLISTNNSLLEVDHIFICVEDAPKVEFFEQAGLMFASPAVQQIERGTASQILFFENFYLELIWVEDEVAAEIYAVRTGIDFLGRSHWRQTQISPFGIALHQQSRATSSFEEEFRRSQPQKTELLLSFSSDNLVTQTEPLCFVIPDAIALPTLLKNFPNFQKQFVSHPLGLRKMTGIEVTVTHTYSVTQPLALLVENGAVQVEQGTSPCLQLTFDNYMQRKILDARAIGIPLVFKF
ncbi:VOC family protein [Nostoc edaphicum CCNP1411]|uniref:VOC family protein n=1 Tax=Nostoc edaphicum CCNP1411 TaxID=1472755 RepID=A0A7D7QFV0_9NOSO|nr:VOC family protein [Nostoc edaphicum]QMS92219.1 VOC family protein [Nostoc edaphicum CCNP1411]